MNIANKLTLFRVLLIPVFLVFMLWDFWEFNNYFACAIFGLASYTDFLDGHLARKHNLVTNFGKFMDPLADKLLVGAALIAFVELGIVPAWITIIIISREFIISGFRLVAASEGMVIAASWWGKVKTVTQIVMILLLLITMNWADFGFGFVKIIGKIFAILGDVAMYLALFFTIVSAIDYIIKNINVLKEGNNK